MLFALVVVVVLGLLVWAVRSRRVLFEVTVETQGLRVVRGKLPASLRHGLEDVLSGRAGVRIVGYVENGRVRVDTGSLPEPQAQRVRNLVGLEPIARLRRR